MDNDCFERLIKLRCTEYREQMDLLKSYLEQAMETETIHLVIMGKDPFPTDSTGIPFCKPDWKKQKKGKGAGYYVLRSVCGEDVFEEEWQKKQYDEPQKLFEALGREGLVFLNASYVLLEGKNQRQLLEASFEINEFFLRCAEHVVICGKKAETLYSYNKEKYGVKKSWQHVVHPCGMSKGNKKENSRGKEIGKEWQEWWGTGGAIKKKFKLDIVLNKLLA